MDLVCLVEFPKCVGDKNLPICDAFIEEIGSTCNHDVTGKPVEILKRFLETKKVVTSNDTATCFPVTNSSAPDHDTPPVSSNTSTGSDVPKASKVFQKLLIICQNKLTCFKIALQKTMNLFIQTA
jgi:hypothetical protein